MVSASKLSLVNLRVISVVVKHGPQVQHTIPSVCRVWHSPGWPCSRSWSCTGDLPWISRQAPWQESGRGGRTWGRSRERQGRRRSNNHVHMHGWDEVTRHGRGPWAKVTVWTHECNASKDGAQRAQNCVVFTSVCIVMFTQLVTVRSGLFRLCMKIYTMFRSLLVS